MKNISPSYIGSHKSNFIKMALLFMLVNGEMFEQGIDQQNWKYSSPEEAGVIIREMHANVVVRPCRSQFNISKDTMGKLHVEKYVPAIYCKECLACQKSANFLKMGNSTTSNHALRTIPSIEVRFYKHHHICNLIHSQ